MQQHSQNALHTTAGPHQQQQYGPPPNMGGYAPPPQQSYPPPDRAGPQPAHSMGLEAGPPGATSGHRESEMRQEEQRRKRFREFKEEKPVRPQSPSTQGENPQLNPSPHAQRRNKAYVRLMLMQPAAAQCPSRTCEAGA